MNKGRWIAVIAAGTVAAMALGPEGPLGRFWGYEEVDGIDGALLGGFIAYGLMEAVVFGVGLAWLAFGRPLLGRGGDATAAFAALGWLLVSWWPHGGLHRSIEHDNYGALLGIEYGFHLTMMVAALLVAWHLVRVSRRGLDPAAQPIGTAASRR